MVITCVFFVSTIFGVDKGIRILSNINTCIPFVLFTLALIVEPKNSIFNTLVNGVEQHIQNFFGDYLMIDLSLIHI